MTLRKINTIFQNVALHSRPLSLPSRGFSIFHAYYLSLNSTWPASRLATPSVTRRGTRRRTTIQSTPHATISSQSTSFQDPNHPSLFYHLVGPPTPISLSDSAFALSFLASPPVTADSPTIIGWLPAQSNEASSNEEAGLNDFRENPRFRDILHKAILDTLQDGSDEIQINGALQLQQGWLHIHDERNLPALNRIGDPDDILASVLVRDSKIIPETYQPMPSYRFCTSDGVIQPTPGVAKKLQTILQQVQQAESKVVR